MMRINTFAVVLSLAAMSAGSLFAADLTIVEDFSVDFGSLVDTGGSGTSSVTGGQALIGGAGNDGRDWYGTTDTDYATVSFTAEVDVVVEAGTNNDNSLYLGLGVGNDADNAGQGPGFDEPSVGPAVYAAVRDNAGGNHILGDFDSTSIGDAIGTNTDGPAGPGTHTLRLSYDQVAQTATFSIDLNQTGSFSPLSTVDTSDNGFDATNSRIFIGAANARAFDNFKVMPFIAPPLGCDVNGNGACNSTDFATIRDNLFQAGVREDGDLNGDGMIDFADYRLFKDDPLRVTGFDPPAATAVPEPTSVALVGICSMLGAGLVRRSSSRRCVS